MDLFRPRLPRFFRAVTPTRRVAFGNPSSHTYVFMTFSATGLSRFVPHLQYPVAVLGKDSPTAALFADRQQFERLIDSGMVTGWGSRSKLRGVRLCEPARKSFGEMLATPAEVKNLPCCGDVTKAFTIADGPWRQWRNNPHPRPSPNQNRANHGN